MPETPNPPAPPPGTPAAGPPSVPPAADSAAPHPGLPAGGQPQVPPAAAGPPQVPPAEPAAPSPPSPPNSAVLSPAESAGPPPPSPSNSPRLSPAEPAGPPPPSPANPAGLSPAEPAGPPPAPSANSPGLPAAESAAPPPASPANSPGLPAGLPAADSAEQPPSSPPPSLPWIHPNFLALTPQQSNPETARIFLIPVPYDSTTSYRAGARDGPAAIIAASAQMEDYDPELDLDLTTIGIHTTPALEPHMAGPELMTRRIQQAVAQYIAPGRRIGILGGEHSLSAGSVHAHLNAHPSLTVLYLDAHADLRNQYQGTPWGHASGARRIHDRCPIALVGIRSLSLEERDYIRQNQIPTWQSPPNNAPLPADEILAALSNDIYISIDLDVLDPALMPAVGTPEPGGLNWHQLTTLLRQIAQSRRIIGFDICELAPAEGPPACAYTAARLVAKLAAYSTLHPTR